MLHLLSSLFFLVALAAGGLAMVTMVRRDGDRILSALFNETPARPTRPWQSRVRTVASPRPVSVRLCPRRAVA